MCVETLFRQGVHQVDARSVPLVLQLGAAAMVGPTPRLSPFVIHEMSNLEAVHGPEACRMGRPVRAWQSHGAIAWLFDSSP